MRGKALKKNYANDSNIATAVFWLQSATNLWQNATLTFYENDCESNYTTYK